MPAETRVVEMQFKNRDFERNIEKSQKSLERFKKELNFDETSRGIDKFSRAIENINLTKLETNIQKLTDKFTGLGKISEFVLSRIRHDLEKTADSAIRFAKSLTFDQLDAGMAKFESVNKSIKTIMAATGDSEEKVADVMERLNQYTDQTSYSFSDMASNIGKFTSVGIPLEQAEKQMEGIANWAARSGAGINEASRAMYNLSQAMGVGALKLMDWKSIENAGMATKEFKEQLIQAGLAAGTLVAETKKNADGTEEIIYKTSKKLGKQVEVNFSNLSTTLNKGWATTEVIGSTLMGYYYDDLYYRGEHALRELTDEQVKMFNDMFAKFGRVDAKGWKELTDAGLVDDEMKARLLDAAEAMGALTVEISESGEKIYKTTDATGKEIKFTMDTFEKGLAGTWLTKNIAKTVYAFDDLAEESYKAAQKCLTFTDVINAWKDMISTGWMATFTHIFGNMSESMKLFSAMCDKVSENILGIFAKGGTIEKIFEKWETMGGRESLWGIIIGETEDPDEEGKMLYEEAYGIIDIIHSIGSLISDAFWDIMKEIALGAGYSDEELANWEEDSEFRIQFLAERIKNVTDSIQNMIFSVREFFQTIPEGATQSRWETIKEVIKIVFRAVQIAAQAVEGIWNFFMKVKEMLGPSFAAIGDLFRSLVGNVAEGEKGLIKSRGIVTFFEKLAEFLRPVIEIINKVVVGVSKLIKEFVTWGKESGFFVNTWQKIKEIFKSIFDTVVKLVSPVINAFGDIFNAFKELFAGGITPEKLKAFKEKIKAIFVGLWDNLKAAIKPAAEKLGNFFKNVWNAVSNAIGTYFNTEGTLGNKIVNWIRNAFDVIKKKLAKLFPRATESIGSFFKKIGDWFARVFSGDPNTGFFENVKNWFVNVYKNVSSFFNGDLIPKVREILGKIKDFFGSVAPWLKNLASDIRNFFVGGFETAGSFGEAIKNGIHAVVEFLRKITPEQWALIGGIALSIFIIIKLVKLIKIIAKAIADVKAIVTHSAIDKTPQVFQTFAGKMLLIAAAIGIIALSIKMMGEMDLAKGAQGTAMVAAILIMMVGFIWAMKKVLKGKDVDPDKGLKLKDFIGLAISLIAVSIAVNKMIKALSLVTQYNDDELKKMGLSLAAIIAAFTVVAFAAGKAKFKATSGLGFILMAGAVWLMLKSLEGILKFRDEHKNWDGEAITAMILTLVLISAAFATVGHFAGDKKGVLYLAALAISISVLLKALQSISKTPWDELGVMAAALAGILAEFIVFLWLIPKEKDINNTGLLALVGMAIGIYALIKALTPVASMSLGSIGKMLAMLGGIILGIAALIYIVNKFEGANNRGLKKSGLGSIILIAGGIFLLIQALMPVAKMSPQGIEKMLVTYAVIVAGIAVLVAMINSTMQKLEKGQKTAKASVLGTVIAMVIGIIAIIEVLKPLADSGENGSDWGPLLKMLVPFVAIVGMLTLLMKVVGNFSKEGKQGAQGFLIMLGVVLVLQTVIHMMKLMPFMKTEKVVTLFAGIALIFFALSSVVKAVSNLQVATFKEFILKLLSMVVVVAALGAVMYAFSELVGKTAGIDPGTMLAFAVAMVPLAGAIYIVAKAISDMKVPRKGMLKAIGGLIGAVVAIGALMLVFSMIVGSVEDVDPVAMLAFAAAITILSIGVAALAKVMPALGNMSVGGIAKGALAIAAIGAVVVEIGSMAVDKITDRLIDVGSAVSMFSSMMEGVDVGIIETGIDVCYKLVQLAVDIASQGAPSKTLDEFSTSMQRIGSGIELYWRSLKGLDLKMVGNSAQDLVAVSEALSTLKEVPENAGIILSNIGAALDLYSGSISAVNLENTPNTEEIRQVLSGIAEAIPQNDIFAAVSEKAGEESGESLTTYALGLVNIAKALSKFAEDTADINLENIDKAIERLKKFSTLGPTLKSELTVGFDIGGFINFSATIVEEKGTLDQFAIDIVSLSTAIVAFGEKVGGITKEQWLAMDTGIRQLNRFSALQNSLAPVGGFLNMIMGTQDLSNFSKKMKPLGQGLKDFADNIRGVKELQNGEAETATLVLSKLGDAAQKIPNNSGIFAIFSNKDITLFAEQIPSLGEGLAGFVEKVNGIEGLRDEQITTAASILIALCEASSKIPANAGIGRIFSNVEYDKFAEDAGYLAEGVKNFSDNVQGIQTLKDRELVTAASILVAICQAAAQIPANSGLSQLVSGINYDTFADGMGALGKGLSEFAKNAGSLGAEDFYREDKVVSMVNGFANLLSALIDAQKNVWKISDLTGELEGLGEALSSVFTVFLFGIVPNDTMDSVYRADLVEIYNNLDRCFPIIEGICGIIAELNDLSTATTVDPDNIRLLLSGIAEGLSELLTFDSDTPWTDKHQSILEKVSAIMSSFGSMSWLSDEHNHLIGTTSHSIDLSKWFSNIVDAYQVFIDKTNEINDGWDMNKQGLIVGRIKSIADILNSIEAYVTRTSYSELGNWFTNLAIAYGGFITQINDLEASGTTWNDSHSNTITRLGQIADILIKMEGYQAPVIAPVLDMTSINEQIGPNGEKLIPTIGFGASYTVTMKLNADQFAQLAPKDYTSNLSSIENSINNLNTRINNMNNELRNLKMVMDTGAVVGAIGPGMDRYLGRRSFYAGRGMEK